MTGRQSKQKDTVRSGFAESKRQRRVHSEAALAPAALRCVMYVPMLPRSFAAPPLVALRLRMRLSQSRGASGRHAQSLRQTRNSQRNTLAENTSRKRKKGSTQVTGHVAVRTRSLSGGFGAYAHACCEWTAEKNGKNGFTSISLPSSECKKRRTSCKMRSLMPSLCWPCPRCV